MPQKASQTHPIPGNFMDSTNETGVLRLAPSLNALGCKYILVALQLYYYFLLPYRLPCKGHLPSSAKSNGTSNRQCWNPKRWLCKMISSLNTAGESSPPERYHRSTAARERPLA